MTPRPEVITLCGSMRFFPLMLQVAAEETAAGRIVLGGRARGPGRRAQGGLTVELRPAV